VADDYGMSVAIDRSLRAGGLVPTAFAAAESALEADAVATRDPLVLEIHPPGMLGLELYRRPTEAGEKFPAIFIAAHDKEAVRDEAALVGANTLLAKPFSGRALLDAVARTLATR